MRKDERALTSAFFLPTDLLTFASGPFEYKEDSYVSPLTGKTVPLRVYATSDIIHQVSYALEVTKNAVPLYEKMFDIPYALPKLDSLVASDFDAGGESSVSRRRSFCSFPRSIVR